MKEYYSCSSAVNLTFPTATTVARVPAWEPTGSHRFIRMTCCVMTCKMLPVECACCIALGYKVAYTPKKSPQGRAHRVGAVSK